MHTVSYAVTKPPRYTASGVAKGSLDKEVSEIEPDLGVIKIIASDTLPVLGDVQVKLYAEGGFNKVYILLDGKNDHIKPQFLFRVNHPSDSYLRNASEAATITFIRQNTTIPVGEIVAYDPSPDNLLGYSWSIIRFIDSITLADAWDTVSWEQKQVIAHDIYGYIKQLRELFPLPAIGSLFFEGDLRNNTSQARKMQTTVDNLVIGPRVELFQFTESQQAMGPFTDSKSYLVAELQYLKAEISRCAQNFKPEQVARFHGLFSRLHVIAEQFFPEDGPEPCCHFTLHHPDLCGRNILLDRNSHQVVGIIDWEGIQALPSWDTPEFSPFLDENLLSWYPTFVYDKDGVVDLCPSSERQLYDLHKCERAMLQSLVGEYPNCSCNVEAMKGFRRRTLNFFDGGGHGMGVGLSLYDKYGLFYFDERDDE
jgi:hypothetical protein